MRVTADTADRLGTAKALAEIQSECDDSTRLSLMPLFNGMHGADDARPGWFLVLESLMEDSDTVMMLSPWRLDGMRRFGMLYAVGEGGDATTIYEVDSRAVAHALGAA